MIHDCGSTQTHVNNESAESRAKPQPSTRQSTRLQPANCKPAYRGVTLNHVPDQYITAKIAYYSFWITLEKFILLSLYKNTKYISRMSSWFRCSLYSVVARFITGEFSSKGKKIKLQTNRSIMRVIIKFTKEVKSIINYNIDHSYCADVTIYSSACMI